MIARMKFVGLGVLAVVVCAAACATVALASSKPKPELVLKTADEGKKGGTVIAPGKVAAGWYVSLGEKGFCQLISEDVIKGIETKETEAEMREFRAKEGSMTLASNSNTKADTASGTVALPACYEEEPAVIGVARFGRRPHPRSHPSFIDAARNSENQRASPLREALSSSRK